MSPGAPPPQTATCRPSLRRAVWLGVFYSLVALLSASAALCVFVAICFKRGSFPYVWPVRVLRAVVSVFFNLLYVSAFELYLVAYACEPDTGFLQQFTSVRCFDMPHLPHAIVGIVSCAAPFQPLGARAQPEPPSRDGG